MQLLRTFSIFSFSLLFLSCSGPKHDANPILIEREIIDSRFDTFLKKMENEEHFTGVALVMIQDEVVHAKGYGMANSTSAR